MVKLLVRLCCVVSIASCAAARGPAERLDLPVPPNEEGDEIVLGAVDDPELARRDFEIAQYRAEDPRSERARSARATCRLTEGMIAAPGGERSDLRLSLSAGGLRAMCRGRRTEEGGKALSYHASGSSRSGAARIHGGLFVPGFALGLVFGGSGGPSLASGVFPFGAPPRIAGTTSYFLEPLNGAAAEIRGENLYAAIFGGRPVVYGSSGPEGKGAVVSGARVEARRGGLEAGVSCSTGSSDGAGRVFAIDGRWGSAATNAGFEMGLGGSGPSSLVSGFSHGVHGARGAILLYAVSQDAAGYFGSVNGRALGKAASLDGVAAVAERDLFPRIRARASIDRYERRDATYETERCATRLECERRGKRLFLKLAGSWCSDTRHTLVPYPPVAEDRVERSCTFALLPELRLRRGTLLGAALKRVEEEDGAGWLFAPVARVRLLSERLRVTASLAVYRTARGHPVCYAYQPSLEGSFPVRALSCDSEIATFIIGLYCKQLRLLCHLLSEGGASPEISLQASAFL